MEALPEKEQPDQDIPVGAAKDVVASQRPGDSGEEEDGGEREKDGKAIESLFGDLLAFAVGFGSPGSYPPEDGGQADQQGHVRDVVDQGILDDHAGVEVLRSMGDEGEDEVADPRAVRHDERSQHGALHSPLAHQLQTPDHEQRAPHEQAHQEQWVLQQGTVLDGGDAVQARRNVA
jgi:hypothetical protein